MADKEKTSVPEDKWYFVIRRADGKIQGVVRTTSDQNDATAAVERAFPGCTIIGSSLVEPISGEPEATPDPTHEGNDTPH